MVSVAGLELQPAHGAVLACVAATAIVHNVYMGIKVGKARKQYGVEYPNMYAPEGHKNKKEFDCVQRGHQNSLENLPTFYALLLTAGLRYPISASVAAAVYLAGRVVYFNGYCSGDPKKRMQGGFNHFGMLALLGMVTRWSVELLAPALGF